MTLASGGAMADKDDAIAQPIPESIRLIHGVAGDLEAHDACTIFRIRRLNPTDASAGGRIERAGSYAGIGGRDLCQAATE